MKVLSCSDADTDCSFTCEGQTEEEVTKKLIEHAKQEHFMKDKDVTEELREKMKGIIKDKN